MIEFIFPFRLDCETLLCFLIWAIIPFAFNVDTYIGLFLLVHILASKMIGIFVSTH